MNFEKFGFIFSNFVLKSFQIKITKRSISKKMEWLTATPFSKYCGNLILLPTLDVEVFGLHRAESRDESGSQTGIRNQRNVEVD